MKFNTEIVHKRRIIRGEEKEDEVLKEMELIEELEEEEDENGR